MEIARVPGPQRDGEQPARRSAPPRRRPARRAAPPADEPAAAPPPVDEEAPAPHIDVKA